jgi:hypothetical protein
VIDIQAVQDCFGREKHGLVSGIFADKAVGTYEATLPQSYLMADNGTQAKERALTQAGPAANHG